MEVLKLGKIAFGASGRAMALVLAIALSSGAALADSKTIEKFISRIQINYADLGPAEKNQKTLSAEDHQQLLALIKSHQVTPPSGLEKLSIVGIINYLQKLKVKEESKGADQALVEHAKKTLFKEIKIPGADLKANDFLATITKIRGINKIFYNRKRVKKSLPQARMKGETYNYKDAHKGDSIKVGDVLQTGPRSFARIIFNNGGHLNIGPMTAYRIVVDKGAQAKSGQGKMVDLLRGSVRAVFKKDGVRKGMKLRSQSVSMGIRGTDVFFEERSVDSGAKVSVLRGQVKAKSRKKGAKEVTLQTGMTLKVPSVAVVKKPMFELNKFDDDELEKLFKAQEEQAEKIKRITKTSVGVSSEEDFTELESSMGDKVKTETTSEEKFKLFEGKDLASKLEARAYQMIMEDVMKGDPAFFRYLMKNRPATLDGLNQMVLERTSGRLQL